MGRIDYSSIISKIRKCLNTSKRYQVYKSKKAYEISNKLSKQFQNVLAEEINNNGYLGSTARSALDGTYVSGFKRIGENVYKIDIDFAGDMYRPSLIPSYYGGIEDIAALLNNGYEANRTVTGYWATANGYIKSLQSREGAHFAQDAASVFSSTHNNLKDGFRQIIINDKYR